MSVHVASWITCDRCGDSTASPTCTRNDAKSARRLAKRHGWATGLRSGRDLCASCREAGATE